MEGPENLMEAMQNEILRQRQLDELVNGNVNIQTQMQLQFTEAQSKITELTNSNANIQHHMHNKVTELEAHII